MNNKKLILIINGPPRSGKDSMVDAMVELKFPPVTRISSVDKVKEAAKLLGWDGEKTQEARKFLSDLKFLSSEFNNGPFEYAKKTIKDTKVGIVTVMIREHDEIETLFNWCRKSNIPAFKILVVRPGFGTPGRWLNEADKYAGDNEEMYDLLLMNDFDSLEDWKNYIKSMFKDKK